jgi:hypothetical protein
MQELINDAAKAGNLPEILRVVDEYALPTLVPNFGFVRAIIRLHARLFTLAVVAPLLGGTGGGRHASTDRVCQHSPEPLFSRHLRSFKKRTLCGCPPGPPATPHGLGWVAASTRCEGYPLIGAHPCRKCPAVRKLGHTALIRAANHDHPEVVEKLVVARADLNTKHSRNGCALPLGPSGDICRSPTAPIVPAPSGRDTALHYAAYHGHTESAVRLLVGGADQSITNDDGCAVPPSPKKRRPHTESARNRRRRTPRQDAEYYNNLAEYDAAVAEVRPPASSARSSFSRHVMQAMPRHARSTAQPALFGIRRRTCGMMCASHCVRSAGAAGRQRVGREHSTLQLTVRGTAPHAAHTGT